ncbi:MAG: serine hydrolase [Acidimicrobiales bacterium]
MVGPGDAPSASASTGVEPNSVQAFGTSQLGDLADPSLNMHLIGMASTVDGGGYWLVAADGGVFAFGDAAYQGSAADLALQEPVVGMAADPATGGYWLVAADGGIFAFDAPFYSSEGGQTLDQPVVGMASTADGGGYWLVAADGGVFAFGDAAYQGSAADLAPHEPIVGMASDPATGGYWLVAADGGIFAFDAPFYGSEGGQPLDQPVVGMASTYDGGGYWLVASDGGVFAFGTAPYRGTAISDPEVPALAIIGSGVDGGYRVAYGHATDPLGAEVSSYLSQRAGNVTAAVYEPDSGATYDLNPGVAENTASIVKVDIMATALIEAEQGGQGIPADEQALMPPMIEQSDNTAASEMYNDVGGPRGVAASNGELGLTSTAPSLTWGLTTTTAADQVKLVSAFAYPSAALSPASRSYGLSLMENVEPVQDWGVSAGIPAGVPVALKNGWLPLAPGDWQVNSVGYVSGDGRDYVLAILTNGNPTESYGIATIEQISSLVFAQLAPT